MCPRAQSGTQPHVHCARYTRTRVCCTHPHGFCVLHSIRVTVYSAFMSCTLTHVYSVVISTETKTYFKFSDVIISNDGQSRLVFHCGIPRQELTSIKSWRAIQLAPASVDTYRMLGCRLISCPRAVRNTPSCQKAGK